MLQWRGRVHYKGKMRSFQVILEWVFMVVFIGGSESGDWVWWWCWECARRIDQKDLFSVIVANDLKMKPNFLMIQ
jgi:hypothetical protein